MPCIARGPQFETPNETHCNELGGLEAEDLGESKGRRVRFFWQKLSSLVSSCFENFKRRYITTCSFLSNEDKLRCQLQSTRHWTHRRPPLFDAHSLMLPFSGTLSDGL